MKGIYVAAIAVVATSLSFFMLSDPVLRYKIAVAEDYKTQARTLVAKSQADLKSNDSLIQENCTGSESSKSLLLKDSADISNCLKESKTLEINSSYLSSITDSLKNQLTEVSGALKNYRL